MKITWSINRQTMRITHDNEDRNWSCQVSSVVRNELNGWRPNPDKTPKSEVVHAITSDNRETDIPVMPRHFPIGTWRIYDVEFRDDRWRRPLMIMTDAWQYLDEWSLNSRGGYDNPTGRRVKDFQYHLHFSESGTTQGCIKIHTMFETYRLAAEALVYIRNKEPVFLEVTV